MTPEQQRIKIAEACGLQVIDVPFIPSQTKAAGCVFTDAARAEWRRCYPNSCCVQRIPDYLNDLNAMYDALAHLTPEELRQWAVELTAIVLENNSGAWWDLDISETAQVLNATAAQRAEAFLRTKGLLS